MPTAGENQKKTTVTPWDRWHKSKLVRPIWLVATGIATLAWFAMVGYNVLGISTGRLEDCARTETVHFSASKPEDTEYTIETKCEPAKLDSNTLYVSSALLAFLLLPEVGAILLPIKLNLSDKSMEFGNQFSPTENAEAALAGDEQTSIAEAAPLPETNFGPATP